MSQAFRFEKADDNIGILIFDLKNKNINKFSSEVMTELDEWAEKIETMNELKALIFLSGKKDSYIVGADVHEIVDVNTREEGMVATQRGQEVFHRFSQLPFLTVAVIHGACMGGGTEISLAFDYRMATDHPKTRIGLPEVTLGFLPGWGGTQRLPRLIGLQRSLDIILTGRQLNAKRALKLGLVDKIIPPEWIREKSIEFVNEILSGNGKRYQLRRKPKGLFHAVLEKNPIGRKLLFSQAQKSVLQKTEGNYPAPLRALEVIKQSRSKSLKNGLSLEAEALADLVVTPESKNLVQIFIWTDQIKKENGSNDLSLKGMVVLKSAVLGAGVMGGGIAQLFASRNIPIRVKDINYDAVAKAYQQAASVMKAQVKRRKITREEFTQNLLRISGTTTYSGMKNTDLVIEAIVEDLKVKQSVLAELENHIPDNTIVASNTSSLRIDDMVTVMKRKERFVGMHFFNPVHRMPLVEIIRGKQTTDEIVTTIFNLCKKLGKTPIVVNDGPGFLVNRILVPYMVEAVALLEEGNDAAHIDTVMRRFGMPMGPFELFDEVGIDVAYKVAKILQDFMSDRMAESDLLPKMIEENRLGKKSGKGFYRHAGKKREFDAYINTLIIERGGNVYDESTIINRMVYSMINEASRCIEEKIAEKPRDVDVGMIFGTGFAPFRGGLLKFADSEGTGKIVDTLMKFTQEFGSRFSPGQYLKQLAESDGKFYN